MLFSKVVLRFGKTGYLLKWCYSPKDDREDEERRTEFRNEEGRGVYLTAATARAPRPSIVHMSPFHNLDSRSHVPSGGNIRSISSYNNQSINQSINHVIYVGARVVLACRNAARGEEARQDISNETGSSEVVFISLDLSSLKSIRAFVQEFKQSMLINYSQ